MNINQIYDNILRETGEYKEEADIKTIADKYKQYNMNIHKVVDHEDEYPHLLRALDLTYEKVEMLISQILPKKPLPEVLSEAESKSISYFEDYAKINNFKWSDFKRVDEFLRMSNIEKCIPAHIIYRKVLKEM